LIGSDAVFRIYIEGEELR